MKIFWDTNLFIYLWEDGPITATTQEFSDWIIQNGHETVTSALTIGEILVHPILHDTPEVAATYVDALNALPILPFDASSARIFAKLRATIKSLRPPDAIQLACAIAADVDVFVTNDTRLNNIPTPSGMKIIALAKWQSLVGNPRG